MTPDPCPFCGGRAVPDRMMREGCAPGTSDSIAYFVRCISCAAEGPWNKTSDAAAVKAWNNRVTRGTP